MSGLDRAHLAAHTGREEQAFGVRLVELADGPGRGVRVLEFRTMAGLAFEVIVDRAFDIGAASIGGRGLSYASPVGVQGPWFREPHGMESWLRGFGGGLLTTGGLDHTMGPAEDDAARFAYSGRAREAFPLHGRLNGEPARLAGYGARWEGDACTLWAEGVVRQASLYGENLEMTRRVECDADGAEIRIADVVANLGAAPQPSMSLYHVNLGWPLIAEGARIVAPAESVRPRGGFDASGWDRVPAPRAGFAEEVIELRPRVRDGRAHAAVVSAGADLMLVESWDAAELPWLLVWRQFAPGTYVLGLEPSTNAAADRHAARDSGELKVLEPGESRRFSLRLGAVAGREAVSAELERLGDTR